MDNMAYSVPVMPATAPYGMGGMNDGLFGSGGTGSFILGLLFGGGGRGGLFGGNTCGNPCAPEANAASLAGLTTQVSEIQNELNTNNILSSLNKFDSDTSAGLIGLSQAVDNNAREILGGIANVGTALASGNFTTLQSINGAVSSITAQNNQAALQNLNSFNNLTTTTLQGFNEVGRDAANYANQLVAGQNNLSHQIANCCCDLKSAICTDGNLTRALINDIRVGDLQTQLQDSKTQISNLTQTSLLQNELCTLRASLAELKCCACGIPSQNAVSNRVI